MQSPRASRDPRPQSTIRATLSSLSLTLKLVFAVLLSVFAIDIAYLNAEALFKNNDAMGTFMKKSNLRSDHSNTHTTHKRIVLLAGPHKTGSTSIQKNLMHWLRDENHPSDLAETWAWPSPVHQFIDDGNVNCSKKHGYDLEHQVFYWWIKAIAHKNSKDVLCLYRPDGSEIYKRNEFLKLYKNEFYNGWTKGKSLAIATEALDFVGGQDILDNVMQQLPRHASYNATEKVNEDDITVVIVYRSPRVAHLESMWHQCCMMKNMSFYQYLVDSQFHHARSLSIDSLKLSEKFLQNGLKVALIDMEGVMNKGYDISNIVACDILGANCNANKTFVGMKYMKTEIANVKSNMEEAVNNKNVTTDQMDQINSAILRYDCNYAYIANHPNVTVLYSFGIANMLKRCEDVEHTEKIRSLNNLRSEIVSIVKN